MPRTSKGARLILLGPDNRFGAKRRKGFRRYVWYIADTCSGKEIERSTGVEFIGIGDGGRSVAEGVLADYIAQKRSQLALLDAPAAPREQHQVKVGDVLAFYATGHAQHDTLAPERLGYAIDALTPFWGERTVAEITTANRRAYAVQRVVIRRDSGTGRPISERPAASGTVLRELSTLDAACRFAVRERLLAHYADEQWMPDRSARRERWLTREEAAALLRAARNEPKARHHLPLFILLGLYHGARKEAILSLQWQPNTQGGWVDLQNERIDFRPLDPKRAKSKKKRALAPIPPRLLPFLKAARKRTRQYVIEAERPVMGADGVTRMEPGPLGNIKRAFATAAVRAGLCEQVRDVQGKPLFDDEGRPVMEPNITPHGLRHSAITWLLQDGIDIWKVSGFIGVSVDTIERTYGHHCPKRMDEAMLAPRGKRPAGDVAGQAPRQRAAR